MNEDVKKYLDKDEKIRVWPKRKEDKKIVVEYLSSKFEPERVYSEKEVNEIILSWHTFNDHTLLRRELIEQKLLCRTPDCKEYRLIKMHDKMTPALIIIDLQEYFHKLDSLKFENKINPNIKKLLQCARESKIKIIHVITIYKKDKSNWPEAYKQRDSMWCMENTEDAEIIPNALPQENETVIIKKRFSSFYETELDEVLQQNKIDTLFIAGYSGDVCVRMTTMDAFNRGYNLFWVSDCIESLFEEYNKSEEYIKNLTKLKAVTIDEMKALIGE